MGIPFEDWMRYVLGHRLKFKFEGLGDTGRSSPYFTDVREAAVSSESFMNEYMRKESEYYTEEAAGDLREIYVRWLRKKYGATWTLKKNIRYCADSTVFRELDTEDRRQEFGYEYPEPEWGWEAIRAYEGEQIEALLKEHPPEKVWSYAGEYGFPVEELFFVCPSCHGEPAREEDCKNYFACGSCGCESALGPDETMVDFIINLGLEDKLFPFNEEKRKEWRAKIEAHHAKQP